MPTPPTDLPRFILSITPPWSSGVNVLLTDDPQETATIAVKMLDAGLLKGFTIQVRAQTGQSTPNPALWDALMQALKSHMYGLKDEPVNPSDSDFIRIQSAITELRQALREEHGS